MELHTFKAEQKLGDFGTDYFLIHGPKAFRLSVQKVDRGVFVTGFNRDGSLSVSFTPTIFDVSGVDGASCGAFPLDVKPRIATIECRNFTEEALIEELRKGLVLLPSPDTAYTSPAGDHVTPLIPLVTPAPPPLPSQDRDKLERAREKRLRRSASLRAIAS